MKTLIEVKGKLKRYLSFLFFAIVLKWSTFDIGNAFIYVITSPVMLLINIYYGIGTLYYRFRINWLRRYFRKQVRLLVVFIGMLIYDIYIAGNMFFNISKNGAEEWEYYVASGGLISIISLIGWHYGFQFGQISALKSRHKAVSDDYSYSATAREKIKIIFDYNSVNPN